MAVTSYDIKSTDVIHETSVDFTKRIINAPINLMQYDNTLPIIAVELLKDNNPYYLPDISNVYVYIRWGLPDHSFIHKQILGCSPEDRHIVYFAVEEAMVLYPGKLSPILEVVIIENNTKKVAGSSYIYIEINQNPIQKSDVMAAYKISHLVDVDAIITNPPVTGDEPILSTLGVGNNNYILPVGTPVIPNPDIDVPDVTDLIGLKISGETFKMPDTCAVEKKESEQSPSEKITGIVFVKI